MARLQRHPHEKEEDSHSGTERWLLTYADMITLLMAFFILLTSISIVDAEKFRKASSSLTGKFGYAEGEMRAAGGGLGFGKADSFGRAGFMGSPNFGQKIKLDVKALGRKLRRDRRDKEVRLAIENRGLVISLTSGILFDVQSATLKPSSKEILEEFGNILAELSNPIVVEGHADERSPSTRPPPSPNWDLSARRALAVMNFLVKNGFVEEKRLSLGAFASNKPYPTLSQDPEEKLRLNRRVDLVVLGESPFRSRFDVLVAPESANDKNDKNDKVGW